MFKTKHSIKKSALLTFLIIYFTFLLFSFFNLYIYNQHEISKKENIIENYTITLSNHIEDKLLSISNVSKYPLLIPDIDKLNSVLKNNSSFQINNYNYLKYICEMMLIQNDEISGSFIYDLKGRGTFSSRNSSKSNLINPSEEDWFQNSILSSSVTSTYTNISSELIYSIDDEDEKESLIAITRKIIDLKTNEITGILLVTISSKEFLENLKLDLPFENQVIYLYDENNNIIFSNDEEGLYKENLKTSKEFNTENENSSLSFKFPLIKKDDISIISNKLDNNWFLILITPRKSLINVDSFYLIFLLINILFYFISSTFLYSFINKRIFSPLNLLINNMSSNKIEKDLNNLMNYSKNDEISLLFDSYNSMKVNINELININYKNKIEQKELELNQLQNQINPHFIYNTLESIHMMAEINDDIETSKMAEYFGSIIRYGINRKVNIVSLEEEINIIKNYIYLQKIRFDQLFTIENSIPEELLECKIIKMIIQPLIENSIYHGLSECDSNGKIIIQGIRFENNLLITISDNGIGISDSKLLLLNDYINDKNNSFSSIGLRNINRRIKLNYGEDYGLEIFSVLEKGTSVVITLPYTINY